jgi:hypothetical protein
VTATERPGGAPPATQDHDEDAARLAALGYKSEFSREMSLRANVAEDARCRLLRQLDRGPIDRRGAGGRLLYMAVARPWEKSTAAAGDAVSGEGVR